MPGLLREPILQDHEAAPLASARLATRPSSKLAEPAGVMYSIEHEAFGVVWTVTLALPPGLAVTTDVNAAPWVVPVGVGRGARATKSASTTADETSEASTTPNVPRPYTGTGAPLELKQ
jgi:hypothetical protein